MDAPSVRQASCRCGRLVARCEGEPVRISVCHCLDCQKRSGSAFAVQARFPIGKVEVNGEAKVWTSVRDSGSATAFSFCPECGSTVFYRGGGFDDLIAVAVGAFADPSFPAPRISVWEERQHGWVAILGGEVEHFH